MQMIILRSPKPQVMVLPLIQRILKNTIYLSQKRGKIWSMRVIKIIWRYRSSQVGFAPMMIDSVLQQYGWEQGWALLSQIAANARLIKGGGATFASDILTKGERGIAPTIDFFIASAIANGAALHFIYPAPVAYSPAQIAITAATAHVDAAKRFVNFVLSEKGQRLLFHSDIRKLPIRPAVYKDKPANYFDPFQAAVANPVVYGPNNLLPRLALVNALFDVLITERQQRLQTLLQKLHTLKATGKPELATIRLLLTQPPIDEKTAQDATLQLMLTKQQVADHASKNQLQMLEKSWRQALDLRYAKAESLLKQAGQ
jgi:spermidine/putrescine-binding protein